MPTPIPSPAVVLDRLTFTWPDSTPALTEVSGAFGAGDMVRRWRGALIVVSHDLALLELMDETAELYGSALTTFGGPYSQWRAAMDAEQATGPSGRDRRPPGGAAREARPHPPGAGVRDAGRHRAQGRHGEARARHRRERAQACGAGVGGASAHRGIRQGGRGAGRARPRRTPGARRRRGAHRPARPGGRFGPAARDARQRGSFLGAAGTGAGRPRRPERRGQDDAAAAARRGGDGVGGGGGGRSGAR